MSKLLSFVLWTGILSISLASTANATLESRLGGKAYYDTELNITWLADANAGKGTVFDYDNDGLMTGYFANEWVNSINIDGITGWRFPNLDRNGDRVFNVDVNSGVFDMQFNDTCFNGNTSGCSDNEMGYLYWVEGITPATSGPFMNIQPYLYISENIHSGSNVWEISFYDGSYGAQLVGNLFHAWAVHDGDVASLPIPEPQTYLMFLAGFGLLGFMLRLRTRFKFEN
ncbi:putative secreted protein with PEP-CTERM sorting signal [Nitrosomonas oligotropha]|uniref:Putative secreted protein with PEP-CTERM sorting signal n=1 Tax=Nitrosomonas oligotropha TaxID=42354 RepID=A0A2T5HYS4_9PROT|nr:PEP-CTERM sorting domain-containing protein [Nitrosomonas oligotropha]PTQ76734.1 putative secreted protein with PEP-CTERM sorting signal [Nitrosomonas oligotropha]